MLIQVTSSCIYVSFAWAAAVNGWSGSTPSTPGGYSAGPSSNGGFSNGGSVMSNHPAWIHGSPSSLVGRLITTTTIRTTLNVTTQSPCSGPGCSQNPSSEETTSQQKIKGILLPRNYVNFPLVKLVVSKIAYTSPEMTKNEHFLTTSHRKVVRENFFRDFGYIMLLNNLSRLIRVINRTNSRPNWIRRSEKLYHWKKVDHDSTAPPKENAQLHGFKEWFITTLKFIKKRYNVWNFLAAAWETISPKIKVSLISFPLFTHTNVSKR